MSPDWNLSCIWGFFLRYILMSTTSNSVATTSNSTSPCPYVHPQRKYCTSNFVFQAKKVPENKRNGDKNFRVTRVFKALTEDFIKGNRIRILADNIPFEDGLRYLFAGSWELGNYTTWHVERCDWVMDWDDVKKMQERGLQRFYNGNGSCDCMIENRCLLATGENICTPLEWAELAKEEEENKYRRCETAMMNSIEKFYCYNKYARCMRGKNDRKCRWKSVDGNLPMLPNETRQRNCWN